MISFISQRYILMTKKRKNGHPLNSKRRMRQKKEQIFQEPWEHNQRFQIYNTTPHSIIRGSVIVKSPMEMTFSYLSYEENYGFCTTFGVKMKL